MKDPTIFPLAFDPQGNLIQLVGYVTNVVMEARPHCKIPFETDLQVGARVELDGCYLDDEVSPSNATLFAHVIEAPTDDEALVGVEYDNGSIDFVPQNILILV